MMDLSKRFLSVINRGSKPLQLIGLQTHFGNLLFFRVAPLKRASMCRQGGSNLQGENFFYCVQRSLEFGFGARYGHAKAARYVRLFRFGTPPMAPTRSFQSREGSSEGSHRALGDLPSCLAHCGVCPPA